MVKNRKFLFLNLCGDFLWAAQRLENEGYETFSWYSDKLHKGGKEAGKGIINIVDDYFDVLNQFRNNKNELIILIDDNSWGDACDYLKSEGWNIIGSSHFSDVMEHDRTAGMKLAKHIGLKIPPSRTFNNFDDAIAFVENIGQKDKTAKLVFKADGVEMAGSSKTYTSKDVKDCLNFIDWVKKDQQIKGYKLDTFEIQIFIEGTEADFSCWTNGDIYLNNIALDFEEKKINGLGAAQGCYGQIITFEPAAKSKFFREYFMKLLPILKKYNSINEWAANTIISSKNGLPYFLEWTPRFGWDSTQGELAILQDSGRTISSFFIGLADKQPFPKGYFPKNKFSATVRLFSESTGSATENVLGKPIYWNKKIEKDLWFYSIKKDDFGKYVITDKVIGDATATGDSIQEAVDKVYKIIDPKNNLLNTPDLFYSTEIGKRAISDYQRVKELKWF